jgi:hypothetical protein
MYPDVLNRKSLWGNVALDRSQVIMSYDGETNNNQYTTLPHYVLMHFQIIYFYNIVAFSDFQKGDSIGVTQQ